MQFRGVKTVIYRDNYARAFLRERTPNLRDSNIVAGWSRFADIFGAPARTGERSEGSEAGCMGQRAPMTESVHFVVAVWSTKRQNPRTMNPQKATIVILATLFVSLALAEDFKTVSGKIYKDATISHVEADGIVLRTKSGISKVYFVELPKDVQERFQHGSATPVGKAVTQRFDEVESAKHADGFAEQVATQLGESADKFAEKVSKKLDEREAI
jgi:hypothetical protein